MSIPEYSRLDFGGAKFSAVPLVPVDFFADRTSISDPKFADTHHGDFANEYIGGGVLNRGNVQEEIYFTKHPEAIASMIMAERMLPNEAIQIDGAVQYSTGQGYGGSFAITGPYEYPLEHRPKIKHTSMMAMDALDFRVGG